jgi:hypothetical protein
LTKIKYRFAERLYKVVRKLGSRHGSSTQCTVVQRDRH